MTYISIIEETCYVILVVWIILFCALKLSRATAEKRFQRFAVDSFFAVSTGIYLFALIYITILCRNKYPEHRFNLELLWEYRGAFKKTENGIEIQSTEWLKMIVQNIMLFIPAGMLWGHFRDVRTKGSQRGGWLRAAEAGAVLSLTVEMVQLVTKLGLFELCDILNNTIGMLIGFAIDRIILRICSSPKED